MAWVYLLVAGLFEIGFAVGLKQSDGFTRPLPVLFTLGCLLLILSGVAGLKFLSSR